MCASDATWDGSSLSYSAKFGSHLATNDASVLFEAAMTATTLTCNYETDISKSLDFDSMVLDKVENDGQTKTGDNSSGELAIDTTVQVRVRMI